MDAERTRGLLLKLPHVVETMQWGDNLVFWAGDKAIGGKMFALVNLDGSGLVISFAAGPEHAAELCEREGLQPAPYFARIHWVAAERWDVLNAREWESELRSAYERTLVKLPRKTQQVLALPAKERAAAIAEGRRVRAAKDAEAATAKALRAVGKGNSARRG